MNMILARKAAYGLKNAADFARGQLLLSKGMAGNQDNLDIPGFSSSQLDLLLFTIIGRCTDFLQSEHPEVQVVAGFNMGMTSWRGRLCESLLGVFDNGESMRLTQFNFLAESMRIVQERYGRAVRAGAFHHC